MALDEVLLEAAPDLGKAILRFYSWTEPAATFGYFQKFAEVQNMTKLHPLIRRPTGGGLVPHDLDWTYSLIVPPSDSWYRLRAVESYQRLHQWIQAALLKTGLKTDLSAGMGKESSGQCFVGAEKFDLVWETRKIAGAAQRRTRQGLLIQGSIQPPLGLERASWEEAFCEIARERWKIQWQPFSLPLDLESRVRHLAEEKYFSVRYNEAR